MNVHNPPDFITIKTSSHFHFQTDRPVQIDVMVLTSYLLLSLESCPTFPIQNHHQIITSLLGEQPNTNMRRKKVSSFDAYPIPASKRFIPKNQTLYSESQLQPTFTRQSTPFFPDSLQRFQQEIEKSLLLQREENLQRKFSKNNSNNNKRRAVTEAYEDSDSEVEKNEVEGLRRELSELKVEVQNYKKKDPFEDKLDQLIQEMTRNRELDRELLRQRQTPQHFPQPNNIFYPPQYPQYPPETRRPRKDSDSDYYQTNYRGPKPRRPRRNLRKVLLAVAFTTFLRGEARTLARQRKAFLRTFYLERFNSQMVQLKNWLVEGHSYCFPIVLEKQRLDLNFWDERRESVAREKQVLLLKIVQIGLEKTKQECTPSKIALFSEILLNICSRGSFVMSRFWSALEMKSICISEYLGCIRADQSLEKVLLTLMVFVKVLVFNMLLQPSKFDPLNFPKNKQPLSNNMHIIASLYYRLASNLVHEYLQENRPKFYALGNWLQVQEEFIVECCEPLRFDSDYPDPDEWISGMVGEQLAVLEESSEWGALQARMKHIVESLHGEMMKRRKDVLRNHKYKLYN